MAKMSTRGQNLEKWVPNCAWTWLNNHVITVPDVDDLFDFKHHDGDEKNCFQRETFWGPLAPSCGSHCSLDVVIPVLSLQIGVWRWSFLRRHFLVCETLAITTSDKHFFSEHVIILLFYIRTLQYYPPLSDIFIRMKKQLVFPCDWRSGSVWMAVIRGSHL